MIMIATFSNRNKKPFPRTNIVNNNLTWSHLSFPFWYEHVQTPLLNHIRLIGSTQSWPNSSCLIIQWNNDMSTDQWWLCSHRVNLCARVGSPQLVFSSTDLFWMRYTTSYLSCDQQGWRPFAAISCTTDNQTNCFQFLAFGFNWYLDCILSGREY